MATIQKRGEYLYHVEIRRKGYLRQTRTSESKAQTESGAREQEHKMDTGQFRDLRPMAQITLDDALGRYLGTGGSDEGPGRPEERAQSNPAVEKTPAGAALNDEFARG